MKKARTIFDPEPEPIVDPEPEPIVDDVSDDITNYIYWRKWATPIFQVENINHNTELLTEESLRWGNDAVDLGGGLFTDRDTSSRVGTSIKSGIYESSFQFFTEAESRGDCPELVKLRFWMMNTFRSVFFSYFFEEGNCIEVDGKGDIEEKGITVDDIIVEFDQTWLHITRDGGCHGAHTHPMFSWALLYYINIGESTLTNGCNIFHSPQDTEYVEFGHFYRTRSVFSIAPVDGKMICFPADLSHAANVYRTSTDTPRLVVAGNVRVHCNKYDI